MFDTKPPSPPTTPEECHNDVVQYVPHVASPQKYCPNALGIYNIEDTLAAQTRLYHPASPASSWAGQSPDPHSYVSDEHILQWQNEYFSPRLVSNSSTPLTPHSQEVLNVGAPLYHRHAQASHPAQVYSFDQPLGSLPNGTTNRELQTELDYLSVAQPAPDCAQEIRYSAVQHAPLAVLMGGVIKDLSIFEVPEAREHSSCSGSAKASGLGPNRDAITARKFLAREEELTPVSSARKTMMSSVPRRRHRRRTSDAPTTRWQCDECGCRFERSYNLAKHRATHDPDRARPYLCEMQGCTQQAFARPNDLQRHLDTVRA
jgi:hypothetical protein